MRVAPGARRGCSQRGAVGGPIVNHGAPAHVGRESKYRLTGAASLKSDAVAYPSRLPSVRNRASGWVDVR
jgi:hypothetical protein